jgi:DNA-binding transcriptional ArsR family regulator
MPVSFDSARGSAELGVIPDASWLHNQELDVTTLAELTAANIPATSQRLAKRRAASVVSARRDGRHQLYQVDDPHILSVINPNVQSHRTRRNPHRGSTEEPTATASSI